MNRPSIKKTVLASNTTSNTGIEEDISQKKKKTIQNLAR